MEDYPKFALLDVIGPLPDLFLDRLTGGIMWLTAENWLQGFMGRALYGNILLWNRKAQTSLTLARFGFN